MGRWTWCATRSRWTRAGIARLPSWTCAGCRMRRRRRSGLCRCLPGCETSRRCGLVAGVERGRSPIPLAGVGVVPDFLDVVEVFEGFEEVGVVGGDFAGDGGVGGGDPGELGFLDLVAGLFDLVLE